MFPNYKEKGIASIQGQLAMFTSDQVINPNHLFSKWANFFFSSFQSHYSIKSCASICGLGTDNCVMVPSDIHGRMIPSELERLILERKTRGHVPFFVNATSGTTVLGAFDPINEIADICQKYGMWLHVDVSTKISKYRTKTNLESCLFAGCLGWWPPSLEEVQAPSSLWCGKVSEPSSIICH